jgi:hypothetical protein
LEAAGARDRDRGFFVWRLEILLRCLRRPCGQARVAKAIQIIGKEFDVTIAPAGVKSVKEIDRPELAS